jgi:hypothetical protein
MHANIREWKAMKEEKIEKLKGAGFEAGDAQKFLKLTPAEESRVEAVRAENKRMI